MTTSLKSDKSFPDMLYKELSNKGNVLQAGPFLIMTVDKYNTMPGHRWDRLGDLNRFGGVRNPEHADFLIHQVPDAYAQKYGRTGSPIMHERGKLPGNTLLLFLDKTNTKDVKRIPKWKAVWDDRGSGGSENWTVYTADKQALGEEWVALGDVLVSHPDDLPNATGDVVDGLAIGDFYAVHKRYAYRIPAIQASSPERFRVWEGAKYGTSRNGTISMWQMGFFINYFVSKSITTLNGFGLFGIQEEARGPDGVQLPVLIHPNEQLYACCLKGNEGGLDCGYSGAECAQWMTKSYCAADPTRKGCKEYCSNPDNNCDDMMRAYCTGRGNPRDNPNDFPNICNCFLSQQYYDDAFETTLKGLDKGLAQVLSTYKGFQPECFYGDCATSDIKSHAFYTKGCNADANIQVCLNKLDFTGKINANQSTLAQTNECKMIVEKNDTVQEVYDNQSSDSTTTPTPTTTTTTTTPPPDELPWYKKERTIAGKTATTGTLLLGGGSVLLFFVLLLVWALRKKGNPPASTNMMMSPSSSSGAPSMNPSPMPSYSQM